VELASRGAVDESYARLSKAGNKVVIQSPPMNYPQFECYEFTFYDSDAEEGLGCYRMEIQYLYDKKWPNLPPSPAANTSSQEITWFYGSDLNASAAFLGGSLGLHEVVGLHKGGGCRVFHVTDSQAYLGVCAPTPTRPPASCPEGGGMGPHAVPTTHTFMVGSDAAVDVWHARLQNGIANVTAIARSVFSGWKVYGFFFTDPNTKGLGCYRFEVQNIGNLPP